MHARRVALPGPWFPAPVQSLLYGLATRPYLRWCQRRFGDTFTIGLPGNSLMVALADPADIKQVFALAPEDFTAARGAPILEPFVGRQSLLLLDGDRHHRERRVLSRALAGDGMAAHQVAVEEAVVRDLGGWPLGRPFALLPRMRAITLDVIVRRVFGAVPTDAGKALHDALDRWLEQAGSLAVLAPQLRHELGGRSPWGRFVRIRAEVDQALDDHIATRRRDPSLGDRTDMLSLLLVDEREHGSTMDDAALRDELITMLAAGHDTSATTLAWAFDLLLHNLGVLARLRCDLAAGGQDYLAAVVKETLRLRPVVDTVGRTLTRPLQLRAHLLPAGVTAAPNILLAGCDPSRYPESAAFRPERFVRKPPDPVSWLPFGGGIRRCLGAAFATMEIETVLRVVLTRTTLRPAGPRLERTRRRAVTLVPRRGTRVVVESLTG